MSSSTSVAITERFTNDTMEDLDARIYTVSETNGPNKLVVNVNGVELNVNTSYPNEMYVFAAEEFHVSHNEASNYVIVSFIKHGKAWEFKFYGKM